MAIVTFHSERLTIFSGRAWNAFELRRKSFKDLHTLWYIVLRERNLLASQRAEAKRLEIMASLISAAKKDYMVRRHFLEVYKVLNVNSVGRQWLESNRF